MTKENKETTEIVEDTVINGVETVVEGKEDESDKKDKKDEVEDKPEDEIEESKMTAKQSFTEEDEIETKSDKKDEEEEEDESDKKDKKDEEEVKEHLSAIFGTTDEVLSEDFKSKASLVFEAAVATRFKTLKEELEARTQAKYEAVVTELIEDTNTKIDDFLAYVVNEWVEENKLAIHSGLQTEIQESFVTGLKELFEDHNITIPEEKIDLLEKANSEVAELKESVNTLNETISEQSKTIFEHEKANIISELSEGLVATQAEKLKTLVEEVEASDADDFKTKANIIKENYFREAVKTGSKEVLKEAKSNSNKAKYADFIRANK